MAKAKKEQQNDKVLDSTETKIVEKVSDDSKSNLDTNNSVQSISKVDGLLDSLSLPEETNNQDVKAQEKPDDSQTIQEQASDEPKPKYAPIPDNVTMFFREVVSCEHRNVDGELTPLLDGVSFQILKNDIVGVSSSDRDEAFVLCEIMGNIRPYYSGYAKLSTLGTMRKKKVIVEKLYYIDTHEMIYSDMTVLEQLLFATVKQSKESNPVLREKEMLDILVDNGLKRVSLSQIEYLSPAVRMVVSLLVAAFSSSDTLILNILDYNFEQDEIAMLNGVVKYAKSVGKTVILVTKQAKLIGICCEKAMYLYNGHIEYFGSVADLTVKWDRVVCIIKGQQLDKIAKTIESNIKHYKCTIDNGELYVRNHSDKDNNQTAILQVLEKNNLVPDNIKFNNGRVENSFNELLVKYDI